MLMAIRARSIAKQAKAEEAAQAAAHIARLMTRMGMMLATGVCVFAAAYVLVRRRRRRLDEIEREKR